MSNSGHLQIVGDFGHLQGGGGGMEGEIPHEGGRYNGALDPWSLSLRFWGAPIFSPEDPKPLFLKGFGAIILWQKPGAPQTQIQRPRIQHRILGPLILRSFSKCITFA